MIPPTSLGLFDEWIVEALKEAVNHLAVIMSIYSLNQEDLLKTNAWRLRTHHIWRFISILATLWNKEKVYTPYIVATSTLMSFMVILGQRLGWAVPLGRLCSSELTENLWDLMKRQFRTSTQNYKFRHTKISDDNPQYKSEWDLDYDHSATTRSYFYIQNFNEMSHNLRKIWSTDAFYDSDDTVKVSKEQDKSEKIAWLEKKLKQLFTENKNWHQQLSGDALHEDENIMDIDNDEINSVEIVSNGPIQRNRSDKSEMDGDSDDEDVLVGMPTNREPTESILIDVRSRLQYNLWYIEQITKCVEKISKSSEQGCDDIIWQNLKRRILAYLRMCKSTVEGFHDNYEHKADCFNDILFEKQNTELKDDNDHNEEVSSAHDNNNNGGSIVVAIDFDEVEDFQSMDGEFEPKKGETFKISGQLYLTDPISEDVEARTQVPQDSEIHISIDKFNRYLVLTIETKQGSESESRNTMKKGYKVKWNWCNINSYSITRSSRAEQSDLFRISMTNPPALIQSRKGKSPHYKSMDSDTVSFPWNIHKYRVLNITGYGEIPGLMKWLNKSDQLDICDNFTQVGEDGLFIKTRTVINCIDNPEECKDALERLPKQLEQLKCKQCGETFGEKDFHKHLVHIDSEETCNQPIHRFIMDLLLNKQKFKLELGKDPQHNGFHISILIRSQCQNYGM